MNITSIKVENFRNLEKSEINFHSGLNIFLGNNGQGKTNLLESIYLMTKGKTFRPSKSDCFVQWDQNFTSVDLQINENDMDFQCRFVSDSKAKRFFVNEKKVSSTKLNQLFSSILFSPESLAAIKEGPEQRRDLIDDFLSSQNSAMVKLLGDYKKIIRTRNKLLKDYRNGNLDFKIFQDVLGSLDKNYLYLGTQLSYARVCALRELMPYIVKAMTYISDLDQNVEISVDYLISSESAIDWNENQVYDALLARYNDLKKAEIEAGVSLVGPHKHDIQFLYSGQDSRYFCSQGQQRALILSFKMAQVQYLKEQTGKAPLLLLDDVLSELDETKRTRLIEFLQKFKAQIFITTTDFSSPSQFKEEELRVFHVDRGTINHAS